jgi:hypothetical protein
MEKLLGRELTLTEVEDRIIEHFCAVFGRVNLGARGSCLQDRATI